MGKLSWIIRGGTMSSHISLQETGKRVKSAEVHVTLESKTGEMDSEDEGRGREPRRTEQPLESEKRRVTVFLKVPRRNTACRPLDFCPQRPRSNF